MRTVVASALFGFGAGILTLWGISAWRRRHSTKKLQISSATEEKTKEILHWNQLDERRGMGDLITKANHIAIIVSDVGRSLSFYVDILGLQQIRRPNFDRHGAWLTMGNIELHLIKGVPVTPSKDNLIVGHIALETDHVELVLEKLRQYNIEFRQNISVPDPEKSRENKFEGANATQKTRVIQYFFTDPDGYYIELCNCDILTKFCLNKENQSENFQYHEGIRSCRAIDVIQAALRWRKKARQKRNENLDAILANTPRAQTVNKERFDNLCRRRTTYGDIMQGFTDDDIENALLRAYNFVPLAVRILTEERGSERYFQPPSFYEAGVLRAPKALLVHSST